MDVRVAVSVAVSVAVLVAVMVAVPVDVSVSVGVSVEVSVAVLVSVAVAVFVEVAVLVLVGVEVGGTTQRFKGELLLRGFGVVAEKSVLLVSVSVQPSPARTSALKLSRAGAREVPSEQFEVLP